MQRTRAHRIAAARRNTADVYTARPVTTLALSIPFADAPSPALSWLLAIGGVVIIGIAKSGFGGGLGVIAVPMMLFAFANEPAQYATGVLLPILIVADVASIAHHWRGWDKPNLRHLLPGSCAGIIAASAVMYYLGEQDQLSAFLKTFIGWVCVLYLFVELAKQQLAPRWRFDSGPVRGGLVGVAAGVVSTFAHAAGPVTSIYLLGQHLDKKRFVGTSVIYYFTVNTLKVLPYVLLGYITFETLWHSVCLVVFVPLGTLLGAWMHQRVNDTWFRWIILISIFATGVKLLWPNG